MPDTPTSVMIFAAGFGTRMGELTRSTPKPLIKVNGKGLIDHTLDLVDGISPEITVVNAHYLADQIVDHLAEKDVKISIEKPDILDTGGGLKAALPFLKQSPVFTSNSDCIWDGPNPFRLLLESWNPKRMDALLVCIRVENCLGRVSPGDFSIDENGMISRKGEFVYGGVQIIKTDRVKAHPNRTFSLNEIWDQIAQDKRLFGLDYPGRWCDVGHPDGIALAEGLLRGQDV
ncbi:nucleotidyltransferase family protein [Cognatishimia activa]|uniref:Nucleotidyltransferase family protein n=1 Tax=Cognatishimia activa TaxID=1715691 RepID=A0A975ERP7_9RHOB|nr:nucleotidyltransferase family protein [Cognatishimia activa]QTN37111.1 nucleotidyltransferase family protein [Cognatishimia activa]